MDLNTIDLNRAEQAVSSLLTSNDKRQGYQPKTIKEHNRGRCAYLPIFPTKALGPNVCLLLANVPITRLAPHELARRQHGADTSDALILMNNYNYSSNHDDGFNLSEQEVEDLAARLQIGKSIITFNADRLCGVCYSLLALHESFQRNILHKRDLTVRESSLNSKQMAIALEFYLQIDVDLFYMKTCSFLGAEPRSMIEGLFCGKDEPEARYTLLPCGSMFCQCCHPPNHWKKSQPWPVIDFISSSSHQFINGYTTYLNCPATCNTTNVIYTMTCPYGHYDYVDSTAETLAEAMAYHREHGNRIIHEKLTGSPLFRELALDPNEREKQMANKMRLYQHSARCPSVLRSFLDCNPIYWCFIPMLLPEAFAENVIYFRGGGGGGGGGGTPNVAAADPELVNVIPMDAIDHRKVTGYLDHVPIPPNTYTFSYRQREKQRLFFEQFLSLPIQQLPYSALDLYKMSIIAVLPDERSMILKYIIQTLFVMHGETKLNMICPLGGDPEKRYGCVYDRVWCANLNCPSSMSTRTSTQSHMEAQPSVKDIPMSR